ncbi:unnamed protein product [Rhodiola kirilowii]
MSDSGNKVETTSRLVQWRIQSLRPCIHVKSDSFRIGNWNWHLSIRKYRGQVIRLYPEITRENPPIASFIIRIVSSLDNRKALTHPGVKDKQLKGRDDFVWQVDTPLTGKFIIEVEFTDLKSSSPNCGEPYSIWTEKFTLRESSSPTAVNGFGRMLSESIHTDITINTSDGSIQAHRAVLSIRSPVFCRMFSHNLKEKEQSTLNISDISLDACKSLLNYIYGHIQHEEFVTHRLALLYAAEKYDISDLKDACQESLIEDIDATNVLERLQVSFLYQLPKLKTSCKQYLVKFGKVCDIQDDFNSFIQCADKELISEIFHEIFHAWKGF